jgi:hypothetical protein
MHGLLRVRVHAGEHAGREGYAREREEVLNTGRKVREELSLHHQVPPATEEERKRRSPSSARTGA